MVAKRLQKSVIQQSTNEMVHATKCDTNSSSYFLKVISFAQNQTNSGVFHIAESRKT